MNENMTLPGISSRSERDAPVKRKKLYVKRQFQQSMLLQSLLITFIITNVVVIATFWAIDTFANLHQLKLYMAGTIGVLEVIGFISLYWLNLKASHRIAGPIFSLERFLRRVEQGNLTGSLQLRSTDQFPETAEQLNATVSAIRNRVNRAQYLAARIQQNPHEAPQLAQQLVDELAHFNTTRPDIAPFSNNLGQKQTQEQLK